MPSTPRSTVRRLAEQARYDADTIAAVLDAGIVAHVGIVHQGTPVVIPMAYARVGDTVYVHGAAASRMMRALNTGAAVCVTVTIVDGIVLARSAFNMSMNYRSVVIQGQARAVTDPEERMTAFRAVMDHVVPGHWETVRPPNDVELRQTLVTAVGLDEVSAKVRVGPPEDEADDVGLPIWAGQIPLDTVPGPPVVDAAVPPDVGMPTSVAGYARAFGSARPR